MNEQQLADALAEQLDAMLAGEALPPTSSNELTELLQVADQLSAATPTPRPEFGATLKASLLQSASGSAVAGGTTLTGTILAIVFGGITVVVVVTLGLIGNNFLAPINTPTSESRPAPIAAPTSTDVVQPTVNPTPTVENTPTQQPTITKPATNTLILPSPSTTAILDVLPPITNTVEPGEEVIFPPAELLPGQLPSNDDDDNSSDSNSGGGNGNSGSGSSSSGDDDDDDDS